ncbi:17S U2 SnRNP complex component HTATSF1-like [Macrobrachium nipponense]|uniref:17S U2 SnRNP complex component HTATSF1-like n=1 Tax=Macrobrachium nipponense TaxID=159736 RepID=UPI0030C89626
MANIEGEENSISDAKTSKDSPNNKNSEINSDPVDMIGKTANSESNSDSQKAENTPNLDLAPSKNSDIGQDEEVEDSGSKEQDTSKKQPTDQRDYEVKDGKYYYTDSETGHKYMYDESSGEWVSSSDHQDVSTDEQGRTYYHAQGMYLCQDPQGNVFYMDKNNEWVPWGTGTESSTTEIKKGEENNKWYFHQGDDTFYRDKVSDAVYKLNKDNNEWEVFEGELKKKRPRINSDEEFDTDEDSDEDVCTGSAPPGAKNDPNIDYDGYVYTKRDPTDNMVYEWDTTRRAWFPKLDEDFMATYQLSYGFNPDGTKNENPLKFDDGEKEADEAEAEKLAKEEKKKAKTNQTKNKPSWFEMDETLNTKVYVSNLPDSTTEEEFLELMSKCGMILKDLTTNKYKIKMYRDSEGNFKGDALCSYIKRESVELALQILDGYCVGNKTIHVELAKFELKGEYNPKLKPPKKKKKELEKLQKKQEKLFDWRPEPLRGQRQKHEKTVIIRNVFNPKEFEHKLEQILTHKEAMRDQCLNFGTVTKLDIHDLHPEGVVQVTFAEVEAADMCAATLNNRLYLGRNLRVSTWDGKEKFRIEETDSQKEERLKKWDKFLESGDKKQE